MSGKYDDIINLPHHRSTNHPHMKQADRAAQFSPFAALTGHDAAVTETARLTDRRVDLGEDELIRLDEAFQKLRERLDDHPEIAVTYFVPDKRKTGGAYVTVTGSVKKLREFERQIVLQDGAVIPIGDVVRIELL